MSAQHQQQGSTGRRPASSQSGQTNRSYNSTQLEKKGRQDLFSQRQPSGSNKKRRNANTTTTTTASEAQDIQQSLLRTRNLLENELHRVHSIGGVIEQDGQILEQTLGDHKSLNTSQAQQALRALQRSQQQEQRYLNFSIAFFVMVVVYVMWSRVLIKLDVISPLLDWFL